MEVLALLFVGKPLTIAAVAGLFFAGYLALRRAAPGRVHQPRWLLLAAAAWGLYAAWEWLVLTRTPDATIRVDLLVIWPLLAVLSAWTVYRMFR
jgi:hypothetical protein